jgi:hypothetical protein
MYEIAIRNKLLDKTMFEKIFLSRRPQLYFDNMDYYTDELLLKSIEKHGAMALKDYVKAWDDHPMVKEIVKKYPAIFNSLDEYIEKDYQALCNKYLKPL